MIFKVFFITSLYVISILQIVFIFFDSVKYEGLEQFDYYIYVILVVIAMITFHFFREEEKLNRIILSLSAVLLVLIPVVYLIFKPVTYEEAVALFEQNEQIKPEDVFRKKIYTNIFFKMEVYLITVIINDEEIYYTFDPYTLEYNQLEPFNWEDLTNP